MKNQFYLILIFIATVFCGSTSAQEMIFDSYDSFCVVNKEFTANQKSLLTCVENHDNGQTDIKFYDANLNVTKTMSISLPSYKYGFYSEYAYVTPTGAKVINVNSHEVDALWASQIDISSITTPEEFASVLNEKTVYDDYYGFIDSDGRICATFHYNNGSGYSWFGGEFWGEKYVRNYYAIAEGKIFDYSILYEYEYPTEGLVWERDINDSADPFSTHFASLPPLYYYDYDGTNGEDQRQYLTQTLFNDDNKWEYLVPVLEEYSRYDDVEPSSYDGYYDVNGTYHAAGLILTREYFQTAYTLGYKVVSEDGSTILTLKSQRPGCTNYRIEGIWKWGGNLYLETYESGTDTNNESWHYHVLYLFDSLTSSVKEVSTVKARPQMARVQGNAICVNLDEADTDSDLMLSNMSGQVLGQLHVAAGQTRTQMNAAQLPKGVYNLTLRRHGQVLNNQKLMVK